MVASGFARRLDLSRVGSSDGEVMPRRALLEPHQQALPESFGTLPSPRKSRVTKGARPVWWGCFLLIRRGVVFVVW